MNIDEVRRNLAAINWALDELPETANVLIAQMDETLGVRIQIESGSGFFKCYEAFETEHRTTQEGYGVIERSRFVFGVKVSEIERA